MDAQQVNVQLWSTPLIGYTGGVYNIPRNTGVLGSSTTVTAMMIRVIDMINSITFQWNSRDNTINFTYARIGSNFYFVMGSSITRNVMTLDLQLDPLTSFSPQISGMLSRCHLEHSDVAHQEYIPFYSINHEEAVHVNTPNSIGNQLNPTVGIFITNVAAERVGAEWEIGDPLPRSNVNMSFPIPPIGNMNFPPIVLPNTQGARLPGSQSQIEYLTRLNAAQSVMHAYKVPSIAQIAGASVISSIAIPNIVFSIPATNGYTGRNAPLSKLGNAYIHSVATGETLATPYYEALQTMNVVVSSIGSPEGGHIAFIDPGTLQGISNLNQLPTISRFVNGGSWNRAVLDRMQPDGEAFGAIQTQMQRDANSLSLYQSQTNYKYDRQQNDLNETRNHLQFLVSMLNGITNLDVGGLVNRAAMDNLNRQQLALNQARQTAQMRLAQMSYDMNASNIDVQEQIRRTVAPRRSSMPVTGFKDSAFGHSYSTYGVIPSRPYLEFLDRHINAYGYPVNLHITGTPRRRNNHSYYEFTSVNVSIPGGQHYAMMVTHMLMNGVRIWETTPRPELVYNN